MKRITIISFTYIIQAILLCHVTYAQSDKVKFGAYSRALQQNSTLDKNDTLNIDNVSTGHVLVDLGVNVNPDKKTQIQAVMRLRTELGAFFGAGSSAALRQLAVKGVAFNFLSYEVGDLFMQMTPYTMFNNYSEGNINESAVFSDIRRDYAYYENLNIDNKWWQQGAHTDFAIGFKDKIMQKIKFEGFFLRNRTTNFFSTPSTFHAGGKTTLVQSNKIQLSANYLNLFDVAPTLTDTSRSARNPVASFELNADFLNNTSFVIGFSGEGGFSQLNFKNDTLSPDESKGAFVDGALTAIIKNANLKIFAGYSYVHPYFFSSAAQTKRINFQTTPDLFPFYGNDPMAINIRYVTLFDIVRNPALYNPAITYQLMAYNPMYSNTFAYGLATPNRQGMNLGIGYVDSAGIIKADVKGYRMSEVVKEGTPDAKRNFLYTTFSVDFYLNKLIDFKKTILLKGGISIESTKRNGDTSDAVDLKSNIIDVGIEIEALKKFDLLVGTKILNSKGNEFLGTRNIYNRVTGFVPVEDIYIHQLMVGYGLRYRFSKKPLICVQAIIRFC